MMKGSGSYWRRTLTRRTLLKGALGGAVVMYAGCGQQEEGASGQQGGSVAVGVSLDVAPQQFLRLHPASAQVKRLVFNTLTEYDPQTLELLPSLAEYWEFSDDNTTLTMQLRDDVKFHSGRPFGPEDAIFSLEAIQDEENNSQVRTTAEVISDVGASGPAEVTFRLAHSVTNIFDLFQFMPIVDEETLSETLEGSNVIGTGPFMWEEWTPGTSLRLVRNDNYWRENRPYLDEVELQVKSQSQAQLSALQAGQNQLALGLAPRDLASLRDDERYQLIAPKVASTYYVGCNTEAEPFDSEEVRQAVAYAIDRERILEQVFAGEGTATSIWWIEGAPGYSTEAKNYYTYDPERARQLLEDAGATGATAPVAIPAGQLSVGAMAEIVQSNLSEIGLNVELEVMESAEFVQTNLSASFSGLWVNLLGMSSFNPVTSLKGENPLRPEGNTSHFESTEYIELVDRAWKAGSEEEEQELLEQVTNLMLDEAFNIPAVHNPAIGAGSADFKDWVPGGPLGLMLDDAYLA